MHKLFVLQPPVLTLTRKLYFSLSPCSPTLASLSYNLLQDTIMTSPRLLSHDPDDTHQSNDSPYRLDRPSLVVANQPRISASHQGSSSEASSGALDPTATSALDQVQSEEMTLFDMKRIIKHHRNATKSLNDLLRRLEQAHIGHLEVIRSVLPARDSLDAMAENIRSMASFVASQDICSHTGGVLAQKVFDIPELLEMIFEQLSLSDLLAVQKVNRQCRDAVDGSLRLQRRLGLSPHNTRSIYSPFQKRIGDYFHFNFENPSDWYARNNETQNRDAVLFELLEEEDKKHALLVNITDRIDDEEQTIGSKGRRMLVMQPPLDELHALTNCCMEDTHDTVDNESGITVGDLIDKTRELQRRHRNCINAQLSQLCPVDGHVEVLVTFRALLQLDVKDPIIQARRARERRFKVQQRKEDIELKIMTSFNYQRTMGEYSGQSCRRV